jgi:hypothetical protein
VPNKVNGDSIEMHYGDQIIPLHERLARQDREIAWLKRVVFGMMALLLFHVVLPGEDILAIALRLLGL